MKKEICQEKLDAKFPGKYSLEAAPANIRSDSKPPIKCKKHEHVCHVRVRNILFGQTFMCPQCLQEQGLTEKQINKRLKISSSSTEVAIGRYSKASATFIPTAISIFGDLYDYDKVKYINNKIHVIVGCKVPGHGDFLVTPNDHLNKKSGCPICASSKGELAVLKTLQENNISNLREHVFANLFGEGNGPLRFDFALFRDEACTQLACLIEFQGIQHYQPINNQRKWIWSHKRTVKHDLIKKEFCKNNNIKLYEIHYSVLKEGKVDEYVKNILKENNLFLG